MHNKEKLRLRAAQYYLKHDLSLRKTALKFQIACCTLFKWVKLYKEKGKEGLFSSYHRPWNRAASDIEKRILLMKEHDPGLTVRKAKEHLEKEGVRISIKGVWGIWRRYGYAGFSHKNRSFSFTDCAWSYEAREKYKSAEQLFELGTVNRAAEVLNSIPSLPGNELLPKIPDPFLNIRRRVEKISFLFGKIPVGTYLRQLRDLYDECQHQNLYYSAMIVGLVETMALSWNGEPLKMLKKVEELKDTFPNKESYSSYILSGPRLTLLTSLGFAYTGLLKIKEASDIARTCRNILKRRKYTSAFSRRDLGQLYALLEDFEEAKYWYTSSIDNLSGREKKITKSLLADTYIVKGEYKKALELLRNEELDHWGSRSRITRIRSMRVLTKGMPNKAISLATKVLASLEKEEAKGSIFGCYFTIASAYCSLGEQTRARRILKELLPFLTKNKLSEVKTMIDILISDDPSEKISMPSYEESLPTIKVLLLLKNGQYSRALQYAEKKGLSGVLHRYVFFFPEAIMKLLKKGKTTGLPRTMLNLPVFRQDIPVYSVKFLGNVIVHKKGMRSSGRVKLAPKDTAFLIHLANAKSQHIALDRIYNNFWPNSNNPSRNLAHLLVRIRRTLGIPSHFLYIKNNMICNDCHFITDHGEYLEHLAKAKAFLRADEWAFARTEYLCGFSLFRAAPFKKMYDNWSEDMRRTILGQLEKEALTFARLCSAQGEQAKDIDIWKKLSRIIPSLGEIKDLI